MMARAYMSSNISSARWALGSLVGRRHLLPFANDAPVPLQPLPRQSLKLVRDGQLHAVVLGENLLASRAQDLPLRHQVVADKAEGAVRQQAGADVEVAGIPCTACKCFLREAVLGNMLIGGGEDGQLGVAEGACGQWVLVGVVVSRGRGSDSGCGGWSQGGSMQLEGGKSGGGPAGRRHDGRVEAVEVPLGACLRPWVHFLGGVESLSLGPGKEGKSGANFRDK